MTPAATACQRISHGFQLSGMLQYYSALPFNITSGLTSLQGTAGRPLANGATTSANFDVRSVEFIPRNAGIGNDFLALNARLSRALRISNGVKLEGLVEAFNLTNTPFAQKVDVDANRRNLYNKSGRTFLLGARLTY